MTTVYTTSCLYNKLDVIIQRSVEETIAIKEVWIESGLYGFRTAVKNFGIERFKQNCTKATEGFNHVLHTLKHQNLNLHLKETQQRRWNQMKNAKENFCEKIGGANSLEKN